MAEKLRNESLELSGIAAAALGAAEPIQVKFDASPR